MALPKSFRLVVYPCFTPYSYGFVKTANESRCPGSLICYNAISNIKTVNEIVKISLFILFHFVSFRFCLTSQ